MTELIFDDSINYVFGALSGANREWMFFIPPARFTRPFFASSSDEIIRRKNSLFGPKLVETHMSVELFNGSLSERIGWTLVFDFDFGLSYEGLSEVDESNKKQDAMVAVSRVLDRFNVFYLKDSRNHLWIPDWETLKVQNWPQLYGSEFAVRLHQYLTYVVKLPEGIYIDSNLWKASRHKIRMPYSWHLETGKRQVLFLDGIEVKLEEMPRYWNGEFLTKQQKREHIESFSDFVLLSDEYGREIIEATTKENTELETNGKSYGWIESLLQKSVPIGFRGLFLWLVIMPYLVNVKKCTQEETIAIVEKWIDYSHGDRIRDKDLYYYPKSRYKKLRTEGILPISQRNLMMKYPELYQIIKG